MNNNLRTYARTFIIPISAIIILTSITFAPVLGNKFVSWDDPEYILNNTVIKTFSFNNTLEMFTMPVVRTYCPVVLFMYSLEYGFSQEEPFLYHVNSYVIHIFSAMLVYIFFYLLTRNPLAAFAGAVFFAVLPVHVETVAWVSERKGMLAAFFSLLTLCMYYMYVGKKRRQWYVLCICFFILSLGSKPSGVTIPLVFLLMDHYVGREKNLHLLREKLPFFVLSLICVLVNSIFEYNGSNIDMLSFSFYGLKAPFFYLQKVFLPFNLSIMYPYETIGSEKFIEIGYYIAASTFFIWVVYCTRRQREIFFGVCFFLLALVPVIKPVSFGMNFAADRYMYIPSVGVAFIFGMLFSLIFHLKNDMSRIIRMAIVAGITLYIIWLMSMAYVRCFIWRDSMTLFESYGEKIGRNHVLATNYGNVLVKQGDINNGLRYLHGVAVMRPNDANAFYNIGFAYQENGDYEKAIKMYEKAILLDAHFYDAHLNLGNVFREMGEYNKAKRMYIKAVSISPEDPRAHFNLRSRTLR